MIFNSLGSNYDFNYVIKSLFSLPDNSTSSKLKTYLEKKYKGQAKLLYKNREAIKLALEISNLPKASKVGVNGFTCFVVNQAIIESGCVPVYLDIGDVDMNFDTKNLEKCKDLKALIIQNTFGCPQNISYIESYCNKNGILIIEDLAHAAGSVYPNGKEVGTVGDFTVLSFSQDKIIDAVSGGALIVKNKKYFNSLDKVELIKLPFRNIIRDRFYPLFTYIIRRSFPFGVGKLIHLLTKKLKLLSDPLGTITNIKYHSLTNWHSLMAIHSLNHLSDQIRHRREIASIYINNLDKDILSLGISKNFNLSSNIRFPIFIAQRAKLINYLKKNGVFVSDVWYDAPIAPKKLINKTNYKNGDCPNAEVDGNIILNLPTHINVNNNNAKKITALIKRWINTNQK